MDNNLIKKEIINVLAKQNLGVLATHGEIYPYTSLVGFVCTQDLKNMVFTTLKQTRKYMNIRSRSEASILVNSSNNSPEDFSDAAAITMLGKAEDATEEERKEFLRLYLGKFPFLKEFTQDPGCALVALRVKRIIFVTRFQAVNEIEILSEKE